MNTFFTAINAAPTAIFSGFLLVTILYWVLASLGQVDIDGLDPDIDLDLDMDGNIDADVSAPSGLSLSVAGIMEWLSIGKVPLSLIVSFWVLYGWTLCMLGEYLLRPWLGTVIPSWVYAVGMGCVTSVIALIFTGVTARPLGKVFNIPSVDRNINLIGRTVTITSRTVDPKFGRAIAMLTGSELILDVICREEHLLKRQDQAVVVDYDAERNLYLIAPLPHLRDQPALSDESSSGNAGPTDLTHTEPSSPTPEPTRVRAPESN